MFEYKILYLFDSELADTLDGCGAEGWELVSVVLKGTYNCFLKKQKVTPLANPFTQEDIDDAMREIRKSDGRLHLAPFNTTPDTDRMRVSIKDENGFVTDVLV